MRKNCYGYIGLNIIIMNKQLARIRSQKYHIADVQFRWIVVNILTDLGIQIVLKRVINQIRVTFIT